MASRIVPQDNPKKKKEKVFPFSLFWIEILCLFIGGISLVLFCIGRTLFNIGETIDNEVWGQFGDFIGGVVGTLISYISVRLLVRNLREQMKSNQQQAESNSQNARVLELQQFNEMFKLLFSQYQDAIANYRYEHNLTGKKAISAITKDIMQHGETINGGSYKNREDAALKIYDSFYVNYHEVAPVHFRILYRIFQLIDEAEISEVQRRDVAKIMRCQLSEEELFLLRYNCKSLYGVNMRLYLNRYNLQKHLPILSLLEFSPFRNALSDDTQRNRLNTELSVIRKAMRDLFLRQDNQQKVFEKVYTPRYRIRIEVSADNHSFKLELTKNENNIISPIDTDIDVVLETLGHDNINLLLYDFVCEVFVYSNFSLYNKMDSLIIEHDSQIQEQAKIVKYYVNVTKVEEEQSYPLICAQKQLDNPMKRQDVTDTSYSTAPISNPHN